MQDDISGCMPFTEEDALHEILLKTLIAQAWEKGNLSEENRQIVSEWIRYFNLEGPEKERVLSRLSEPVDSFQGEVFNNELRAALVKAPLRARIAEITGHFESRKNLATLERDYLAWIKHLLKDRIGIEQLFQDAWASKKPD